MTPLALVKKARATSLEPEAWYFVIKSNNGEIVATSEMYSTKANAERGVEDLWSVMSSRHFKVEVEVDDNGTAPPVKPPTTLSVEASDEIRAAIEWAKAEGYFIKPYTTETLEIFEALGIKVNG